MKEVSARELQYSVLNDLARQFGTPLFVYNADRIKHQIGELKSYFDVEDFHINYACKALTNPEILRLVNEQGCGIDTVSIGEMKTAMKCGVSADHINFTPSGAPFEEYEFAIDHGIAIHVDNLYVLEQLAIRQADLEVVLRFNPSIRAGGHRQLQVGAEDSKFGLAGWEVEDARALVDKYNIKVKGVHIHVGSDISHVEDFAEAYDYLCKMGSIFSENLELLNIGGGYKVKYKRQDKPTSMEDLGEVISIKHAEMCGRLGKQLKLVMEPGKYLVSESGYFLAEVTTYKDFAVKRMVYLNSGFNHLIRPMYYGAYHDVKNISRPNGGEEHVHEIVGYLCETDTFASDRLLPLTQPGDLLCFSNAGAYCFQMASNYNSRPKPAEVLVEQGEARLIRNREKLSTFI